MRRRTLPESEPSANSIRFSLTVMETVGSIPKADKSQEVRPFRRPVMETKLFWASGRSEARQDLMT